MNTILFGRAMLMKGLLPALLTTLLFWGQRAASADEEKWPRVVSIAHKDRAMHYKTPHPYYPLQARMVHATGWGIIRISFGNDGKPTGAAMVQSTHNSILDSNTTLYAYKNWRSTPGNPSTMELRVEYVIR